MLENRSTLSSIEAYLTCLRPLGAGGVVHVYPLPENGHFHAEVCRHSKFVGSHLVFLRRVAPSRRFPFVFQGRRE